MMRVLKLKSKKLIFLSIFQILFSIYCSFSQDDPSEYVRGAWSAKGKANYPEVYRLCDACIERFSSTAENLSRSLKDFPLPEDPNYLMMHKVAVCYFIKGETLRDEGKLQEAKDVLKELIEKYPYAREFDPSRGTYWSVKETAEEVIKEIDKQGKKPPVVWEREEEKRIILFDEGREFPVDYTKYGEFVKVGTKDYKYIIKDPIGLAKATGEGIYPNTSSVKFSPEYVKIKKELSSIDHWRILNGRNFSLAFYKWNFAPEPEGVRQFFIADILERSGYIKHALKAYYAILVHFPQTYAWTYWRTPWYVGKASLYRIKKILKDHPELGLMLEDAFIQIINGYDNEIRNDIFIVNPGRLKRLPLAKRLLRLKNKERICLQRKRRLTNIVKVLGGERVKLVQYKSGDWQLFVEGKPFLIKAITYAPTRVGESPDKGTMQNWTIQDTNSNGIIDALESWVDKNRNNLKDSDEEAVGDFQLLKEMGINAIRLYHQPFKLNKKLIRQIHQEYGIYILLGDFLGKYALGSKANWDPGTDYDNPLHQENMLNSVKEMVEEFKDEPAVLMWILGNENVYGVACNADKKPESFFKFANKAAQLIKSLDPQKRPVAIASGDTLYLDIFAKNSPDIDIFGTNMYRGRHGFLDFWDELKRTAHKPGMITEYGAPSYAKGYSEEEAEGYQAEYHKNCWLDILCNSAGFGAGNALGGIAFEWLDEWWKAYEPFYHDWKPLFAGPFLDGYMHEEWLGIVGQGDGDNSPFLRVLKKAYFTYQKLWRDCLQ